jgi:hypothetical protein
MQQLGQQSRSLTAHVALAITTACVGTVGQGRQAISGVLLQTRLALEALGQAVEVGGILRVATGCCGAGGGACIASRGHAVCLGACTIVPCNQVGAAAGEGTTGEVWAACPVSSRAEVVLGAALAGGVVCDGGVLKETPCAHCRGAWQDRAC